MERQTANKKKYGMTKSEGLNKIRNADLYEKVDKHGKIYEKNISRNTKKSDSCLW